MVIPFTATVFGMDLVDSMVFFNVTAAVTICVGVKLTDCMYNMGMFEDVKGLTVMDVGRVPVVLYMVSMRV